MRRTTIIGAAALIAATVLLPAAHGQADSPPAIGDGLRTRAADRASEAATVDDPQCNKPARERVGAWICVTDLEGKARGAETAAERRAEPGAGTRASDRESDSGDFVTAAATEEYCLTVGCWYRNSSVSASFNFRRAYWGWSGTTLGEVDAYADITMTGAQSRSKPVYFGSTRTVSLTMEASRLKVTGSQPAGSEIANSWSWYGPLTVNAGSTVYWNPNGYTFYSKDGTHQSVYHSFTFSTAGYPGVWRMFFKSQKLISTDNTNWWVSSPSNLPSYPGTSVYYVAG